MRKYELFEMGDRETVMDMYTCFTHITNELKSLGKSFTTEELVRKILRFLPRTWEAKVALERNFGYVKQIWVRKEDLCMLKGMGLKKIWVPKTNH